MENIDVLLDRVLTNSEKFELLFNNEGKYLIFLDPYYYRGKSIYIVNCAGDIHGLTKEGLVNRKQKIFCQLLNLIGLRYTNNQHQRFI